MISRAHGLVLSLLLGAATAAGAYAIIGTAHLGDAQTKPEVASSRQIAKRAQKLDAWAVSLQKALEARPPALPALSRYAAVTFVAGPAPAGLAAPVAPPPATVRHSKPVARKVAEQIAGAQPAHVVATRARGDDAEESAAPISVAAPEPPAPAAAPQPVAAADPPAVTDTPAPHYEDGAPATATAPTTLSVEQQCRVLLRAAEGKSEPVKQAAEKQCEALKQAAEREG